MVLAGCGGGGSGDSGTTPTNHAPVVAFTFKPIATPQAVPVDLSVSATDADSDPLTITWKVTRGTLTAQNSKKTIMRWATPSTLGTDTVTVKISDGTVTKTLVEALKVASTYSAGTFQKSKSPYILTLPANDPRLSVLDGNVLTIEAGTEIYINTAGSFFDILGELDAVGTAGDPIVIKQNDRTFACGATNGGRWDGILASGANSIVNLAYCDLWFPQTGVRLRDSSVGILDHVAVRCSGKAGASMEGFGYLEAIDSEFTDGVGDGVQISALPDSVRIESCTLSFNQGSGISMDMEDVNKSVPVIVHDNDIEFNSTHGISLAHSSFPQIHLNNFRGNGDSSVSSLYLQSGYPNSTGVVSFPELDVTCNFWGAASNSQTVIDIGIHDKLDQSTVYTRVKSCPWLNSNPLTTTPNCSMSCP
jgi:hypothetical protein